MNEKTREIVVCEGYDPDRPVGVLRIFEEELPTLRRKAIVPEINLDTGEVLMLGLVDRTSVDTASDPEFDGEVTESA